VDETLSETGKKQVGELIKQWSATFSET